MKYTDARNKANFYSAETIFEEMKAGMQTQASNSLVSVYSQSFSDYTNGTSEAELQDRYLTAVYDAYKQGPTGDQANRFRPEILVGYVESGFNPYYIKNYNDTYPGTLTANADGELYEAAIYVPDPPQIEKKSTEVVLRNITVKFYNHDTGYYSEITSDLAIGLPNIRFSKASELPAVFDYGIVADTGLQLEDNVSLVLQKNIYSGENGIIIGEGGTASSLKGASIDATGADYVVTRGDISVNGIANNNAGSRAALSTGPDTRLYADTVNIAYGNNSLAGKTYIANDLTYNKAGKTTITGDYFGFGNSTDNADKSSAILMNSRDSELDVTGANSVLLSGHAFVGAGGAKGSSGGDGTTSRESVDPTKMLVLYRPDEGIDFSNITIRCMYGNPLKGTVPEGVPMSYDEENDFYYYYVDAQYEKICIKGILDGKRHNLTPDRARGSMPAMGTGRASVYIGNYFRDGIPEGYNRTGAWGTTEIPEKLKYTTEALGTYSGKGRYVLLDKPSDWITPYCHTWTAAGEDAPWPGRAMSYDEETGYYYFLASEEDVGFKFADYAKPNNRQTGDYTGLRGIKANQAVLYKNDIYQTITLPASIGELIINKNNVIMDQSISVKGDQVAYLIPGDCIGVWKYDDDTKGETLVGMNPVPNVSVSINEAGDVVPLFNYYIPSTYLGSNGRMEAVDWDSEVYALGGKHLGDYSREYRVIYKTQYGQTLAYFYIVMDEAAAKQYMMDYYGVKKDSVDRYYNYYTSEKPVKESVSGGNIASAGHYMKSESDILSLAGAATSSIEQAQNSTDIAAVYEALKTKLVTDNTQVTAVEKTRTVYQNLISENRMPVGEVIYKSTGMDTSDDVYAVITGGDVNYPDDYSAYDDTGTGKSKIHLIIAQGNVNVNKDFSGLILAKGTVTVKNEGGSENTVTVEGNRDALNRLLKSTDKVSGTPKEHVEKPIDVFLDGADYVLEGTPVSSNSVKAEDQVIQFGELVRYENWIKK